MDGSDTVIVGTASGVVKARTINRLSPSERWTGSLLDEALGSELTPSASEDDGGRIGIRAPALFDKCDERRYADLTLSSWLHRQLPWMCQRP